MRKIVNFVTDEKFIDDVIRCHDMASKDTLHYYVYVNVLKQKRFKYISSASRIKCLRPGQINSFMNDNKIDAVFLHSLYAMPLHLIPKIPSKIKVFWFSWGYDIYGTGKSVLINLKVLHERTEAAISTINKQLHKIVRRAIVYIPHTIKKKYTEYYYLKAVKRVDYYSGVLPIEYDLCCKSPCFKAKKVIYSYLPSKVFTELNQHLYHSGDNIMIGNSASPRNNHLDILKYLNNIELGNRHIIVPLSYGSGKEYIDVVEKEYRDFFGDHFISIKKFMPLEQYMDILHKCSVGIFFGERQTAMSTIHTFILMGCKVFLSETSIAYAHFCSIGVRVYSIQNELNPKELDRELDEETRRNNISSLNISQVKAFYDNALDSIYEIIG